MTPKEYSELSALSAPPPGHSTQVFDRLMDERKVELLHAQLGLVTESGEFADALKRYLFYEGELDRVNLLEELGDLTWYVALALKALGSSWEEIFVANTEKLQVRYL